MRRWFVSALAVAGFAACGSPAAKDAAVAAAPDPKAPATEPAVIAVPLNVPKPVVPEAPTPKVIPEDPAQRAFAMNQGYSLVGAMMAYQDGRTLGQLYHADAALKTPETTVTGSAAIVTHLLTLARNKSLTNFERTSRRSIVLDDSTMADSGSYVMVLKRSPTDSVLERGSYAAKWRARPDATKWVILEDHLTPGAAPRRKGAR